MIESVIELITPEMALKYLDKNKRNRSASSLSVNQYAKDMLAGKWEPTHQGIAFYDSGLLADGQHRLLAIVRAGIPVSMLVTRGIAENCAMVIDQGCKRTLADAIKIGGGDSAQWLAKNGVVGAVRSIIEFNRTRGCKPSLDAVVTIGNSIKDDVEFVWSCQKQHERGLTTSPFIAALILARINIPRSEKVDGMFKRFQSICGGGPTLGEHELSAHSLIVFARNNIRGTGSSDRLLLAKATQYAFSRFAAGYPLKLIKAPSIESFLYPTPQNLKSIIDENIG